MKKIVLKKISLVLGVFLCAAMLSPAALVAAERDQTGDALSRALAGKPGAGTSDTLRPAKANPCAALGAGFAAAPGSSTCVRISGSVRVDAGAQR
ncbi:MAG: hypothetical protein EKK40_02835 [Bradyrhizobiaceae bacterium]|nr:MAG: hypothetical protein EKK40_02835 [Bradyrhizobiaceae bacterium]